MPMVMRGLDVPDEKALFIIRDVAREARHWGIPFGNICDPGEKNIMKQINENE